MREHGAGGEFRSLILRLLAPLLASALACFALAAPAAKALPGDLDSGFDGDGMVITDFGGEEFGSEIAVQPDGKVVVIGTGSSGSGDFVLARYNTDGTPDASFDGDGFLTTGFGAPDAATSIALQSDGKIVAAGLTGAGPNPENFALVRFNVDGSVDMGFDGDGKVFTDFGADEAATDVAIQPDGKIVAVGFTGSGMARDFAFARYDANGSPDNGFDGDGLQTLDFGGSDVAIGGVAVALDGDIVAAGVSNVAGDYDFALARLDAGGEPDAGFDGDGRVFTGLGGVDFAQGITMQPNGAIVVSGVSELEPGQLMALVRYGPDGSLDQSFGSGGIVLEDFGSTEGGADVALQADGKLLVEGGSRFSVTRYNVNGTRDLGFGTGGIATAIFGGDFEIAQGVAIAPDGKIVALGITDGGLNPENLAVARWEGGEPPAPPPDEPSLQCGGRKVTIRAVPGAQTRGTPGKDVIRGTPKRDRIKAGRGRDVVCGLRGNDRLAGGAGRDLLLGGKGRRDRCLGGPGKDRTRSC